MCPLLVLFWRLKCKMFPEVCTFFFCNSLKSHHGSINTKKKKLEFSLGRLVKRWPSCDSHVKTRKYLIFEWILRPIAPFLSSTHSGVLVKVFKIGLWLYVMVLLQGRGGIGSCRCEAQWENGAFCRGLTVWLWANTWKMHPSFFPPCRLYHCPRGVNVAAVG